MAKKKQPIIRPILFALMMLFAVFAFFYWMFNIYFKTEKPYYHGFGIRLPAQYRIHGIDVSRYQSKISWPDVKSMKVGDVAVGFVFIKATEGRNYVDPMFRRNWYHANAVELTKGAYHFFDTHSPGKAQALNFIEIVDLSSGDLPPVVDIEKDNNVSAEVWKKELKTCLDLIEAHYHTKPIIYTYANFYKNHLSGQFDDYPLWIAHYNNDDQPSTTRAWHFWQHNERGNINGISHNVDFNVFNGDSTAFKNLLLD